MKTTWKEIKEAVYRLMYLDDSEIASYEGFLPDAANYALSEIASGVLPIVAVYETTQTMLTNKIGPDQRQLLHEDSDVVIRCEGASAYSFECDGSGIVTIFYQNGASETIILESDRTFRSYKGFLAEPGSVTFCFAGSFAYRVRNFACYPAVFGGDLSDIPSYGKYVRYDMLTLTEDPQEGRVFASFLEDMPVVRISDETSDGYTTPDYYTERGNTVYVDSAAEGVIHIYYKRYPKKITATTADDYEMPVAPEVCALIPLLMAWRIIKDDDERKAVMYFNEYQNAKAQIKRPLTVDGSVDVWV